jgi:hypothetical protein
MRIYKEKYMHWYNKKGEPRYDADMRTARKERLLPSVTSLLGVIASYGLEQYKLRQMFDAGRCIDYAGESDWDYYKRVKREADKHRRDSAKLGTVVHHLIERYLMGRLLFYRGPRKDVWQIVEQAKQWIEDNIVKVIGVEEILVGDGYAGKADCVAQLVDGETYIIDWKTTDPAGKIKIGGQPKKGKLFYDDHVRQLAALNAAMRKYVPAKTMNVVISTNPDIPGVWTKTWTQEEMEKGLKEFDLAKQLWYSVNNYAV